MKANSPVVIALTFGLLLFFCSATAGAQTTVFTYQGRLNDNLAAANGSYEMRFSLFDQLTGGSQIGPTLTFSNATANPVTVTSGTFTVQLNFGAVFPNGSNRFLRIEVKKPAEVNYTALTPRSQITSAPYAARAQDSNAADALSAACVGCVDNAKINTVAGSKVTGAVTSAANLTGSLAGDVTGTQSATVVGAIGGKTAAQVAASVNDTTNATDANTAGALVRRNATTGGFSAGVINVLDNRLNVTVPNNTSIAVRITNPQENSLAPSNILLQMRSNGLNSTVLQDKFRFDNAGGFVAIGQLGAGIIPASGSGLRMIWYPYKAAFRAGEIGTGGSQWDDSNIGFWSWAGGRDTIANGLYAFSFGNGTNVTGETAAAFGTGNTVSGVAGFSAGSNNTVSGIYAAAFGRQNTVSNQYGFSAGRLNRCAGTSCVVLGLNSYADGAQAVAIGERVSAVGPFSLALGAYARTGCASGDDGCPTPFSHQGAIAIGDGSSISYLDSTANNQFSVRAAGGYRLFSSFDMTTGVTLSTGGGSWTSISDRNVKDNITAVNPRDIFRGVLKLPISTWNYKGQSYRHIGAMAQDFYSTFKVGENDKTITTVDPDGVALAAIQGLNEELRDELKTRDAKIERLETQLETQQRQLRQQQAAIDGLKKLVCAGKPNAAVCK